MAKYWFKGMKLEFQVILDCLGLHYADFNKNKNKFNMTSQQYIKAIENCKPKEYIADTDINDIIYKRKTRPSKIIINNMTPTEISVRYGISRNTIISRFNRGIRTIEELTKETSYI